MRKSLVLAIVGVLCLSTLQFVHVVLTTSEAPAVEWDRTYGKMTSDPADRGNRVIQTDDGGFAIASTSDFGAGMDGERFWLIKTDSIGNVEWNKTYGTQRSIAYSIVRTNDSGYALAGAGGAPNANLAWLVKTDINGSMQWNKTYGAYGDNARSVVQTTDGGYAIAGITWGAGWDGFLIKIDADGNMLWYKSYGGPKNDQFESVVQTVDGGYALAGATQSFSTPVKTEAWLVKTDSNGNMQWNKTFSRTSGNDYGRKMVQTSDEGYAIAGQTNAVGSGDAWLIKTDAAGNLLWNKTYDGKNSDSAASIVQTSDGGYALAGQTDHWGSGNAWLIKTDSAGTMLWNETFSGTGNDVGWSAIQTRDGGYGLTGFTNSFSGDGSYQVWLIKLAGLAPIQPVAQHPIVSISLSSSTSYIGFKVEIQGSLTCNETGLSGASILLSYSVTGGEPWNDIMLVNTTSDGSYSAMWIPSATGNYVIRALWSGNATFAGETAIINLAVAPFEEQNVFSVTSNSTVSSLAFNSTSKELGFTVSGPIGTTGYANVYIAKTLVDNIADVKVYLDGNQLNYTATSSDDSWAIYLTYLHSTHRVTMSLVAVSAPLGTAIIYDLLIAAIIIIVAITGFYIFFRRRKRTSPKPPPPKHAS